MMTRSINNYLALRRALGFKLRMLECHLRSFHGFARHRGERHVQALSAIEWASQAPSLRAKRDRLAAVIAYARHARAENPKHEIPSAATFASPAIRRIPHLYSPAEISALMSEASRLDPFDSPLRPHVHRSLIGLLACTGLRISEALALTFDDVTEDGLLIRETKFRKTRLVPLHGTARVALDAYIERRRRIPSPSLALFISGRGSAISYAHVLWTFRLLLAAVGLRPRKGRDAGPRLHDLRHTFAVRALEAAPKHRAAIDRHLVALSTYLGHASVSATYWYLRATPTLMRSIADACEPVGPKGGAL
jgi:integrase